MPSHRVTLCQRRRIACALLACVLFTTPLPMGYAVAQASDGLLPGRQENGAALTSTLPTGLETGISASADSPPASDLAQTDIPLYDNGTAGINTSAATLPLSTTELTYLQTHPQLTIAYGMSWEPVFQYGSATRASGVAGRLLQQLALLTGVQLSYVPLATATHYDLLACEPYSASLAAQTGLLLTQPYIVLPMVLVSLQPNAITDRAGISEGFTIPDDLEGLPRNLTYYPGTRATLDAVLMGTQTAAVLNAYAASSLISNKRYSSLYVTELDGVSAKVCFAVAGDANAPLLPILNKLIAYTSAAQITQIYMESALDNQPINLSTIVDRMPEDVSIALVSFLIVLITMIAFIILRSIQRRKEIARTTEISAFLNYATKANDDVWEVDFHTRKRWRYRIENNSVVRIPMPSLTADVINHFVYRDDFESVMAHVRKLLNQPQAALDVQERFECRLSDNPSGHYRWSRIICQTMIKSQEHPSSMMVFVMDVDDAIQAEEHKNTLLEQALAAARSASAAKGEFTAYISHEIRSPLNAVLGYLTLAKNNIDQPEKLVDCFVKSEYAANHLLGLINDVLDMGTIESGKLQFAYKRFDLRALLDTVTSIYNAQAKNRGIHYRVEMKTPAELYLMGDDLRVKQVLVNLLSNAMKFTKTGGQVTLSVEQVPAENHSVLMRFCVSDTGIGMNETFQKQLFGAYMQQDASIAAHFGGSGLGLSITKNLVELMRGSISVTSQLNQGTTFTVELPFAVDVSKKTLISSQPDARIYFAGKRLLLVEDNDMNMEIATELLKQDGGFTIDTATNGQEAVDRFMQNPPGTYDAILMDIRMPVMDGYEATRTIRHSNHPDALTLPILAMTADAFAEDVAQATEAGMNGHITKPIDFHHVLITLSEVL